MRGKKTILFAFIISIMLVLSGCSFESGDSLASLPKLPGEYTTLQKKLDEVLAKGYTYAVAESGPNRQSVQLMDMNGDGGDEIIAFFRSVTSGEYAVYVFQKVNENYEELGHANGYGKYLREVHYLMSSGNGTRAIALSWGMEDSTNYSMSVHTIGQEGLIDAQTLIYSSFVIADLTGDGSDEIISTAFDRVSQGIVLSAYSFQGTQCTLLADVPLSEDIKSVVKIGKSSSYDYSNTLYVDSLLTTGGYVTDIIQYKNSTLHNTTLNIDSKKSNNTWRAVNVSCSDIDGDGVLDVPLGEMLPGYVDPSAPDTRWKLSWTRFNDGIAQADPIVTYQASVDDWFLHWPSAWKNNVTVVRKTEGGIAKATFFVPPSGEGNNPYLLPEDGNILLNVWVFSGDNRREYFNNSGMTMLKESANVIYAYSLPKNNYPAYTLQAENVVSNFNTITREWGSEGVY